MRTALRNRSRRKVVERHESLLSPTMKIHTKRKFSTHTRYIRRRFYLGAVTKPSKNHNFFPPRETCTEFAKNRSRTGTGNIENLLQERERERERPHHPLQALQLVLLQRTPFEGRRLLHGLAFAVRLPEVKRRLVRAFPCSVHTCVSRAGARSFFFFLFVRKVRACVVGLVYACRSAFTPSSMATAIYYQVCTSNSRFFYNG